MKGAVRNYEARCVDTRVERRELDTVNLDQTRYGCNAMR